MWLKTSSSLINFKYIVDIYVEGNGIYVRQKLKEVNCFKIFECDWRDEDRWQICETALNTLCKIIAKAEDNDIIQFDFENGAASFYPNGNV